MFWNFVDDSNEVTLMMVAGRGFSLQTVPMQEYSSLLVVFYTGIRIGGRKVSAIEKDDGKQGGHPIQLPWIGCDFRSKRQIQDIHMEYSTVQSTMDAFKAMVYQTIIRRFTVFCCV